MELIIFIITVVLGLVVYLYFQKIKSLKNRERTYYYKRFLKNKLQFEKNMKELENIIELTDGTTVMLTRKGTINLLEYQLQLHNDYRNDYSVKVLKKIKNNNLKRKDRKRYAKMLTNQSEKLYNVEINLAQFHQALNEISCISV